MTRITLTSTVGPDGMLHLNVPIGNEEAGKVVQVTIESSQQSQSNDEWHHFLMSTAGTWQGEFERPDQGEYEQRDELP